VLTSEVPIAEIFTGEDPLKLGEKVEGHENVDHGMRSLMDDLGISMDALLESSIFVLPPLMLVTVDGGGGKICFCKGVISISADGE
jgi:hypothetical protein